MFKRSLFVGIAVVTAMLVLAGCSQATDSETTSGGGVGGGTFINLKNRVTGDELATALADNAVVTLVGDYQEMVTLVHNKDGTVSKTTLDIPESRTLVVGENVTLILDDDHLFIAKTAALKVAKGGALILVNMTTPTPAIESSGNVLGELIVEEGGLFVDMNSTGAVWGDLTKPEEGTGKLIYKAGSLVYGAGGDAAYYGTPGSDAPEDFDLTTATAKAQKRFGPEDDPDATVQLLNGDFIQTRTKYELNGDAVLAKAYGITDTTLQINEGKTATLKAGVAFTFMIRSTGTTSGKLIGGGKLVAGKTEIVGGTGGWQAVVAAAPAATETLTISAASGTASGIEASDTAVQLTGGAGATITQKKGLDNTLTIGAVTATTINLQGTTEAAGAQLILEGDTDGDDADALPDNPGKIYFAIANSAVQIGATFTSNTAFSGAGKIGDKAFTKISTPTIHTTNAAGAGIFLGLQSIITSGITAGLDDVIIDSTQAVAAL
jgi:hypothetical protein